MRANSRWVPFPLEDDCANQVECACRLERNGGMRDLQPCGFLVRRPRMSTPTSYAHFVLVTCLAGALALLAACGSTQSSARPAKSGLPLRVRYLDYQSGQKLELVNDSHSDRTEMYSTTKKLEDAFTKVTTDEVLDETIKKFKENGYSEHGVPGSAPITAVPGITRALEVEEGGRTTFWAIAKSASEGDRQGFIECAKLFAFVYNSTYQLQSVEHAPDWQNQTVTAKKKAQ